MQNFSRLMLLATIAIAVTGLDMPPGTRRGFLPAGV